MLSNSSWAEALSGRAGFSPRQSDSKAWALTLHFTPLRHSYFCLVHICLPTYIFYKYEDLFCVAHRFPSA